MTMKIREGVEFHDGGTLDAEAAKISLERNKAGTAAGELGPITAIDVIDPMTLQLTFSAPAAQFPAILADRAGIVINPAKADDPGLDLQPSGAGMYKVVEYVKDAKIVYEAVEGYWDADAQKAKRVEFQVIQDNNALFNALKGDQVDWGLLTPQQVDEAKSSGLVVEEALSLNMFHVQLNRSRPFLDNVDVRRALSMAIDRQGIADGVLLGTAAVTCQPFPAGYWGHNESLTIPEYDPAKAKEMLQAAGVPEGQQYEMVVPNTGSYPAMAEAIKAMWAEVGVVANIRIVDSVQTAPIFYANQEGDVLVSVFGGRFDPAQHFGLLYTAGPIQNPGQGTWPAMDAAIAEVAKPGTQDERKAAVLEASRVVCEDAVNLVYTTRRASSPTTRTSSA
jgi:peptide/nickel transport system substrate-binding protein